jgi:hypothetical protein
MKSLKPILFAGALVGVLDITAACINARIASGFPPAHVLQSVAGGLLGVARTMADSQQLRSVS